MVGALVWADAACAEKIKPAIATTTPSDNCVELARHESTVADATPGSGSANSQ